MRRSLPAWVMAGVLVTAAIVSHAPATVQAQSNTCAVSPADADADAEEQTALDSMNAARAERGLPSLTASASLTLAATWKSASMAASGYLNHDDPGRAWTQRITDCGYRVSGQVSENLAMGPGGGREAVMMWVASAAHARNLFDPTMRAAGVARVRGDSGWFWTAIYGAAIEFSGPEPPRIAPSAPAVVPGTSATAAATAMTGTLKIGGSALVVAGRGDCLNVRAAPSRSASVATCLGDGARVRVNAGPVTADGTTWWRLDGLGWVSGEFLAADGG